MKIVLVGATGNVGSRIIPEAARRGHHITAIARHPEGVTAGPGVTAKRGDVEDDAEMAALLAGHDVVIMAVKFATTKVEKLLKAVIASRVPRLVVVGGAGSLEVAPGVALVDTPNFPAEYKSEALAARAFLQVLRREPDLNWTYLSPSAFFSPGPRTGKFRVGGDQLLVDARGESRVSMEDYAIALVDELEKPRHLRQRFTVGY